MFGISAINSSKLFQGRLDIPLTPPLHHLKNPVRLAYTWRIILDVSSDRITPIYSAIYAILEGVPQPQESGA